MRGLTPRRRRGRAAATDDSTAAEAAADLTGPTLDDIRGDLTTQELTELAAAELAAVADRGPVPPPSEDQLAELVAAVIDEPEHAGTRQGAQERFRAVARAGQALVASARAAGTKAVASGRWLADTVAELAPRLGIRDHATLVQHYDGLTDEALADALITNAARATAAVGLVGGTLSAARWFALPTLVTVPLQLAVEAVLVSAIEIKLVGELHAAYGQPVTAKAGALPGTQYAMAWADQRGISVGDARSLSVALGEASRRRMQRRLVGRMGRGIGTVAPLMMGAAYGGYLYQRETRRLADAVRNDLRRGPRGLPPGSR